MIVLGYGSARGLYGKVGLARVDKGVLRVG